jgi:hypothetical protein
MREAMHDPRIALALEGGRAAGQEAAIKMQFEREKESNKTTHNAAVERRKKEAAAGLVDLGGGPGQPFAPTVAAQRLTADQARQQAAEARALEQLGISKAQLGISQSQEQRAIGREQRELNPVARVVPVEGSNQGVAMVNGHQATKLPGYEQTAPGVPGMRTPSVNIPWMGQMPSLSFPGAPPSFKQMAKPEKPEKPHIVSESVTDVNGAKTTTHWHFVLQPDGRYVKRKVQEESSNAGMGDVHAAEGAAPASPSTGRDSVTALIQRSK